MKVLVDIPIDDFQALARIAKEQGVPRAKVIRGAVASHVLKNQVPSSSFFGALSGDSSFGDALEYQDKMRAEWAI